MALPADFPQPPKRPPASVPIATSDGRVAKPWSDFFDAWERYEQQVRTYLNGL